jgi:transcriptional regulator with XRE-family HTH domain
MEKNQLLLRLRRKKLGLLISDSRQKAGRTVNDCARAMGISRETFVAYESGELAPSLPELETYAFYLNIPIDHFWGNEPYIPPTEQEPELDENLHVVRHAEIQSFLLNQRDQQNLTIEQLSQLTSIPTEKLQQFDASQVAIPLPELELIIRELGIKLEDLVDPNGTAGLWRAQLGSARQFLELPEELKKFVCQPVNQPYLELAMRLSNLSSDHLRGIAEGILEITL